MLIFLFGQWFSKEAWNRLFFFYFLFVFILVFHPFLLFGCSSGHFLTLEFGEEQIAWSFHVDLGNFVLIEVPLDPIFHILHKIYIVVLFLEYLFISSE